MGSIHQVNSSQLSAWLETKEAVLIDVREPAEHRSESIPHARNLPLSEVRLDQAHLPEHRDKRLVIHCKSGKRAMMACEKLLLENPSLEVWNLEGGIDAWKSSGFPTNQSNTKTLPLDRQVQLTISLMILSGLAVFYAGKPYGLILPLIAGLGLLNAGFTGWCGLALLMAKMPWNK